MMAKLVAKVLPYLILLLAGIALGIGLATWFYKGGEIRALNKHIRAMNDAQAAAEARALDTVTKYQARLDMSSREIDRLRREASHEIQDMDGCGHDYGDIGLFNSARGYRLPESSPVPDAEAGAAPVHPLSVTADYWLADIGEYEKCRLQLNALIDWHRD